MLVFPQFIFTFTQQLARFSHVWLMFLFIKSLPQYGGLIQKLYPAKERENGDLKAIKKPKKKMYCGISIYLILLPDSRMQSSSNATQLPNNASHAYLRYKYLANISIYYDIAKLLNSTTIPFHNSFLSRRFLLNTSKHCSHFCISM